jgi:hypothetical protein
MRLFTLIDMRHLILGFFLGCVAALVIYMAFRYGERRTDVKEGGQQTPSGKEEEHPDGLRISRNPMPPVLLFLLIGFAVWMACYVVFFGILGDPF